jgi:hypothetical protein
MAFECLLVSRDPSVVGTMNRLLGNLSICTNVCLNSSQAFDQLSEGSTDLLVIDCEVIDCEVMNREVADRENDSVDLLHQIQKSGRWQKPTVIAVSPGDSPVPGAHVVLRKPVTEESGVMSLKAAYSRMLYDYRRHARYALMNTVQATNGNTQPADLTLTDIGDGGVGFSSKKAFAIGDTLSFHLLLPGTQRPIYIEARVQWTRDYGAAGCEFLHIPPADLSVLHGWLQSKTQIKKPLVEM